MQTFEEWKSWYEAHAETADPIEGALLYFEPEHGFFYYKVFSGRVLYIDHFATDDYQYLFRRAREMARREHSEESFDVRWSCLRAGKTMTVSTKKKQEPMHAVKVTIQPRLLHPRLRLLVAEEEGLLLLSQVYRSLGQMSTRKSGRPSRRATRMPSTRLTSSSSRFPVMC